MHAELQSLIKQAAADLCEFASMKEADILNAWHSVKEQAADADAKPKLHVVFTMILDLDQQQMDTTLAWRYPPRPQQVRR